MFSPPGTPSFTLAFPGIQQRDTFKVLAFECREQFNQPYAINLELVHEDPKLDPEAFLNHQAVLTYGNNDEKFYGRVYRFAQSDKHQRWTRYQIQLTTPLTYLQHRINLRIFQNRSVPEIITQILRENFILTDYFTFIPGAGLYPPREYCTQYHETDLHFIQRLCEEEHLQFHFEHGADDVHLYFGDSHSAFPMPKRATLYQPDSGLVADDPVIRSFNVRTETRSSWVTRRDYNFETPSQPLETVFKGWDMVANQKLPDYEDYNYPGGFSKDDKRSKQLTSRIQERHRSDYQLATGTSNQTQLHAGYLMEMTGHTRKDWNELWLVTDITHQGMQPQALEESMPTDLTEPMGDFLRGYRNRFEGIPASTVYRPPRTLKRPQVFGGQTARVTGPEGQEIHTNAFGQVKVQFHWDREGTLDERSSCWLRVATAWAGNGYGAITIPRVGMEVFVTFLDDDPDKPIISGCVYNGANDVPYPLPANKTRSVFKTASTQGGGGSNEISFEDKKGAEEIYTNAERDWNLHVGNDQSIDVGNALNLTVNGLATETYQDQLHTTVTGNRVTHLQADEHLTVTGDRHVQTGDYLLSAADQVHLEAGGALVINGDEGFTVYGGGQWITINASGIFSSVPIQVGGAPLVGMPIVPLAPGDVAPIAATPTFNVKAMLRAIRSGEVFCPLCEDSALAATLDEEDDMFAEPEWPEGQVDYKLVGDVEDSDDDEMDFKWLTVPNGQLTFDVEGNDIDDPAKNDYRWFSRKVHWPGGASGVTIGRGYDLGQRPDPETDLAAADIGEPLFSWLIGAKGLKGQAAKAYFDEGSAEIKKALITRKQQYFLFTPIYDFFKNDIIRLGKKPDALEVYGLMSWEDINPKILTVIVDMHYRGDYGSSSRAKLHKLVVENKFEEFYKILSDPLQWANVPVDRFNRRVEFLK